MRRSTVLIKLWKMQATDPGKFVEIATNFQAGVPTGDEHVDRCLESIRRPWVDLSTVEFNVREALEAAEVLREEEAAHGYVGAGAFALP